MRTRIFLLTAISTILAGATPALAQTKPANPPPSDTTAPAVTPSAPEVSVKDASAPAATKSKDDTGHDTLSVDFPDEEIRNILRNVAELFDLNIVIPDTLQGKTSIKLHDVTWRQIFQVVLTPVGYTFVEDGNIIKIVSNESLTQEPVSTEIFIINYAKASEIQPTLASLVDTTAGGKIVIDPRTNSLVITERPSRMKRIKPVIEQLDRPTDQVMIESKFVEIANNDIKNIGVNWSSLSGLTVTATPGSSGLYGYDKSYGSQGTNTGNVTNGTTGSNNTSNANQLSNGSNSTTSVSSTNGVVTNTSTTGTTGSLANTLGNSVTNAINTATNLAQNSQSGYLTNNVLSAVFSADQFKLVLSALQQLNDSKIVSNPTIVTLNNTEAQINVGQQYPIPNYTFNQQTGTFEVAGFTYKDIGIILKVTPQVNSRGFIKLTLAPEVSQNQGTTSFGGASGAAIPIIGTRKATTQVSIKDGYTMGIGGLISTNFNKVTNKIPFLGSIPVIGYLFKQENTNDVVDNLVIFITAKTISAEGAPVEQIYNSKDLRQFQLKRSDLPGYRDGSDPFVDESSKRAKGSIYGTRNASTSK
ncbi:MAG TPA: secretin N-terminal domain-containing protein [Isosphaeraceae bacterium]|nr:secretin N-terminal domain-containing protein [Isosphaeraceae bacterium]